MEYEVLVNEIIYDRYKYSDDVDRLKMKIYGLMHWNVNFQSSIWFPGVKIERIVKYWRINSNVRNRKFYQ